ncbi:GGDEF domain-containing response regulator, partial [Haliangium sp.]|uniref:GGDEF domain-containing response regulator n=1 Tax=Haliangium sp. TaxID=2663208 RepID=UPI003D0A0696
DPDFLARVAVTLGAEGMRVHTIEDPERVLPTLDALEPDALLLDVVMPRLDGFDVCRLLRTNPRWQELPILFVTARSDEEDRIEAFRAGCDDYLVKPIVDAELRARVRVRVERRRLLQARADRDALTGLPMRRPFIESLNARLNEARRHDRTLALCLLDLDEFKSINDTYGHLAGDRALTALGRLLATRFRREDLRARWGGEEFALAFPGETAETMHAAVEKLLAEFSRVDITGDRGDSFRASFSAGVAQFPEDGATLDDLLSAADAHMYAGKNRGRARVVSIPPPMER